MLAPPLPPPPTLGEQVLSSQIPIPVPSRTLDQHQRHHHLTKSKVGRALPQQAGSNPEWEGMHALPLDPSTAFSLLCALPGACRRLGESFGRGGTGKRGVCVRWFCFVGKFELLGRGFFGAWRVFIGRVLRGFSHESYLETLKTFPCGVQSASSISSYIPNFSEISVLHVVRSWKLYYWKWRI